MTCGPFGDFLHVEHVRANEIVDAIVFAGNLLVERHHRFVAAFERHVHVALFVALHGAGHEIVELADVFVVDRVALGLANALHDDLLGGLRGDAAEIFRRHFFVEEIADLIRRAGLLRGDLELRIGDLFDDGAAMEDAVLAGLPIDDDDRVRLAAEVPLVGREQRRFERFEQHLERDVALVRDEVQDVDEFFFSSGVFYGCHVVASVLVCRAADRGARRIQGLPI